MAKNFKHVRQCEATGQPNTEGETWCGKIGDDTDFKDVNEAIMMTAPYLCVDCYAAIVRSLRFNRTILPDDDLIFKTKEPLSTKQVKKIKKEYRRQCRFVEFFKERFGKCL